MRKHILSICVLALMTGCSINRLPSNISLALMDQPVAEVVQAGAPSYLLMLDALILTYPKDEDYLLAGAKLYSAYAGTFLEDKTEAKLLAHRARDYVERGLCAYDSDFCGLLKLNQEQLHEFIAEELKPKHVEIIYTAASTWAGWIQLNSDDWNAIAELGRVKALMQWVVDTQPEYDNGMALVYLAVLESQLPPSLGGDPELAKGLFERALVLSQGHNLMAYVMFAQHYARLMFEQELHDELLQEAIAADPNYTGMTLVNRIAQRQAAQLLAESADYFE